MLKTFHIAPCCYPLILGPVCRQKMHSLGIANSSKIIFAFPVKTTKIFGQHCLHCIQTGPNIFWYKLGQAEWGWGWAKTQSDGYISGCSQRLTLRLRCSARIGKCSFFVTDTFGHTFSSLTGSPNSHSGQSLKKCSFSSHFFVTDRGPNWPFRCLDSPSYISFHLIPEQQLLMFSWSPNTQWNCNWTNNIKNLPCLENERRGLISLFLILQAEKEQYVAA